MKGIPPPNPTYPIYFNWHIKIKINNPSPKIVQLIQFDTVEEESDFQLFRCYMRNLLAKKSDVKLTQLLSNTLLNVL